MATTDILHGPRTLGSEGTEQAQRAVATFRAMLPTLNAYVRLISRNPKAHIVPSASDNGSTDGTRINYRPPMILGESRQHIRKFCDLRDENKQIMCPACAQREEVLITIYHEIGHIVEDSNHPITDGDKAQMLRSWLKDNPAPYAARVRKRLEGSYLPFNYLELAKLVNPYLPTLVGCLEDARVNRAMCSARLGLRVMFESEYWRIFNLGFEAKGPTGEIETILWRECAIELQLTIGALLIGSDFSINDWLHPTAVEVLSDPELQRIIKRIKNARSVRATFDVATAALARFNELGYFVHPEDQPNEEDSGDDESDTDSESEESDESDESADAGEGNPGASEDAEPGDSDLAEGSREESDSSDDREDDGSTPDDDAGSDGDPSPEGDGAGDDQPNTESDPEGGEDRPGEPDDDSESGDDSSDGAMDGSGEVTGGDERGEDEDGQQSGSSEGESTSEDEGGEDSSGDRAGTGSDGEWSEPSGSGGEGQASEDEGSEAQGSERAATEADLDGDVPEPGEVRGEEQSDDPTEDDGSESEPEGLIDEPIDTGADEGEGGLEVRHGSADEAAAALAEWVGHTTEDHSPQPGETQEEKLAVDRAIIQGSYFETPSSNIYGVREHFWNKPVMFEKVNMSLAWSHWHIKNFRRKMKMNITDRALGIEGDFDPEERWIGGALLHTRIAFAENKRGHYQRNKKSGKVNTRVLGKRAPVQDPHLFKRKVMPGKRSYFVLLGVDISFSQVGVNIALTKACVMAQAELLHRAGIPFAVCAHSGNFHNPFEPREGMALDIFWIKEPHEPWTESLRERLRKTAPVSANIDGHTLEYYRKVLDRQQATDKIIMYYTDGKMPAENRDEELEILQREIKTCKRKGYTLMGVGIRTDSPIKHGLDTVQVERVEDTIKVVKHLEKRLLDEG